MPKTTLKENDELIVLPNGTQVLYRDSSHAYWHIPDPIEEIVPGEKIETARVGGVTSCLKNIDKGDGLLWWAWRLGREGVSFLDAREDAAVRGNLVHDCLQALAERGEVPSLASFPEDQRGYAQALAAFWMDAQPVTLHSEAVVAEPTLGLAGRVDLVVEFPGWRTLVVDSHTGDTEQFAPGSWVLDLKTAKDIRVEALLQVAGYRLLLAASGYGEFENAGVVRVGADGAYEVIPSRCSAQQFLAIYEAWRAQRETEREHKVVLGRWKERRKALKEAA
jgi:hypothetical protein